MSENVFILGAGFSNPKGAPLISDFIPNAKRIFQEQGKRLKLEGYYEYFEKVFSYREDLKKISDTFQEDFDDIEKLYSYCDFECRYVDFSPEKLEIRRSLIFVIIKTIDILTEGVSAPKSGFLTTSERFAEFNRLNDPIPSRLKNMDIYDSFVLLLSGYMNVAPINSCIITFNYDVILDNSCLEHDIEVNYFLPEHKGTKKSLPILKLHGSANWMTCSNSECEKNEKLIDVKKGGKFLSEYLGRNCNFCKQKKLMPLIVPPSWHKAQFNDVLGKIWEQASIELKEARRVFIIGYSFPKTDLYFNNLLYASLSFNKNSPEIFIVNSGSYDALKDKISGLFTPIFHKRHFNEKFSTLGVERFINAELNLNSGKYFKSKLSNL